MVMKLEEAIPMLVPNTDAEKRAATLVVCDRATDATDARLMLEALGLVER